MCDYSKCLELFVVASEDIGLLLCGAIVAALFEVRASGVILPFVVGVSVVVLFVVNLCVVGLFEVKFFS